MLGSVVFGARFLFTFDDLAKQAYAATPGPVGKALGKLVGSVLLAHAAVNYQLKNGLKASDTDIARLNTIISTSYLSYHIWGHLADRIQTFDGLITSALLFLLNAFVGYA